MFLLHFFLLHHVFPTKDYHHDPASKEIGLYHAPACSIPLYVFSPYFVAKDQSLTPLWEIFTSAWDGAYQELEHELQDEPVPAPLAIEDGVVSSSDEEDIPTTQPEQTEDSFDPYSDRVLGSLDYVVEEDQQDASGSASHDLFPAQDSQDVSTNSQGEVPDSQPMVDSPGVSPGSPLVSPDPKSKTAAEGPGNSSSMPPPPPLTPSQREARLAKLNAKMTEIKYLVKTWLGDWEYSGAMIRLYLFQVDMHHNNK